MTTELCPLEFTPICNRRNSISRRCEGESTGADA